MILAVAIPLGYIFINRNSAKSEGNIDISVHLMKEYYKGEILRNPSSKVDLTKKIKQYRKEFNGWTNTDYFNRLLNAVELRNKDSLVIRIDAKKMSHWQQYIRWIDTLLIEPDINKQALTFKQIKNNEWESEKRIAYLYPKNLPAQVWNRQGSCFSENFYNSLTEIEKEKVKKTLAYNKDFFLTNANNRVSSLDDLNAEEWMNVDKNGNGFTCYQKLKPGSVKVKKLNETTLLFTFDGYSDFSYLEKNLNVKYIMNYSFIQIRDSFIAGSKWYFATGLLFSNLNLVKNTLSNSLTYFSKRFRRKTPGLFLKYSEFLGYDIENSFKDSVNASFKKSIDNNGSFFCTHVQECNGKVNQFKKIDESFAGLYKTLEDQKPPTFYTWYKSKE